MNVNYKECLLKIKHLAAHGKWVFYTAELCAERTLKYISISDLNLAATWSTATDVSGHRVQGQEGVHACPFWGAWERRVGLLRAVPPKDIWICLACQVDAPSCWERHSSWSFQSLQHWKHDTPDYHSNSWEAHIYARNSVILPITITITTSSNIWTQFSSKTPSVKNNTCRHI